MVRASRSGWIVFDYGEVISQRTPAQPILAARLGVDLASFAAAYREERASYVLGQSDLDYWRSVGRRVSASMDEATALDLTRQDIAGWLHVDPAALALVSELHEGGYPLALLSNAPASLARAVEHQAWTAPFAHLLFSADLGVAKPDARIWSILTERLDTTPDRICMIDDRPYNVEAARALGLDAILWRGAEAARAALGTSGRIAVPPRHLTRTRQSARPTPGPDERTRASRGSSAS